MSEMVGSRAFARGSSKLWRPKCEGLQVHTVETPLEENSIRDGENSRDAMSEREQLVCDGQRIGSALRGYYDINERHGESGFVDGVSIHARLPYQRREWGYGWGTADIGG